MGVLQGLKESVWPSGKRKLGSPIFVEEDGPILGVVDDVFVDKASGNPLAYRILASGQYIELPAEAVTETPGGYVYRSPWFSEADGLVRKLEGHGLLMPELFFTSPATTGSDKKLLESAMQKSPALKEMVADAKNLHTEIGPRLEKMQKERTRLVGQIADLTEAMATGGIDKESYRQGFVALKRRLQVIEATVRRGESLRSRLEAIPFIRMNLNGNATHDTTPQNGHSIGQESSTYSHHPQPRSDEWKRIKKVRVLKSEKEMVAKEARLKELEVQLREMGLPVERAVSLISEDFPTLMKAHKEGPEALRKELERRLSNLKENTPEASATTEVERPDPLSAPTKTCPLCGEPLTGQEKSCPACHADMTSLKAAGKSAGPPGKVDVFLKGGGATKTGVVLLVIGAALFALRMWLH